MGKKAAKPNRSGGDGAQSSSAKKKKKKKSKVVDMGLDSAAFAFPTIEFAADKEDAAVDDNKKNKKKKASGGGFQAMDLAQHTFRGVMKLGFKVPTPIQRKSIPTILVGGDVVAMARTGSGKTAAFVIPLFEKLGERHKTGVGVRAVVLSPTRELAMQTYKVVKDIGRFTNIVTCLLVGGASMEAQFDQLSKEPDVIVATPGRLMHHLLEVRFSLKSVEYCVFDEADRLFEMGFAMQLNEILRRMGDRRQTCLFSATMPKQLGDFVRAGMTDPTIIRLDTETKISDNCRLQFLTCRKEQKPACLLYMLRSVIPEEEQAIVFTATRHHAEFLHQMLQYVGLESSLIYGTLDASARKINLAKFRTKKVRVMLVTDVAARGIDIPLLDNVINYDFPDKAKLFVHRVGRVARAGRTGAAFSFVSRDEMPYMIDLHLFLGIKLRQSEGEQAEYDNKVAFYGGFPLWAMEQDGDHVRQIIKMAHLELAHKRMMSSYKMYYASRGGASQSSVRRSKELADPLMHPMFIKQEVGDDTSAEAAKHRADLASLMNGIRSFKSTRTIWEVEDSRDEVMTKMRRNVDHAIAMRARDKALRAKEEEREREASARAAAEADANNGDVVAAAAAAAAADAVDDTALGVMGTATVKTREERQRERVGKQVQSSVPAQKKRMSKSERKALKKRQQQRKQKQGGGKGSSGNQQSQPQQQQQQQARKQKRGKQKDFKDPKFFVSAEAADVHEERGYAIHDRSRPMSMIASLEKQRIEEAVMDVGGDDHDSFRKARKVKQWDKKKRKYVQTTVGGDPFKSIRRNEAGVIIKDKKGGPSFYEKWQQKTKQSVATVATAPAIDLFEGGEGGEGGDKAAAAPTSRWFKPDERSSRGGGKKRKGGGATEKYRGPELKDASQIKKARREANKNKMRHSRGGGRGRGR